MVVNASGDRKVLFLVSKGNIGSVYNFVTVI